jgi:hypothetical protein
MTKGKARGQGELLTVEAPAWMWRLYHAAEHYLNWRWIIWGYQRLTRGFSDRQLWDLRPATSCPD